MLVGVVGFLLVQLLLQVLVVLLDLDESPDGLRRGSRHPVLLEVLDLAAHHGLAFLQQDDAVVVAQQEREHGTY